jgi:hypothetical protein
MEYRSPMQAPCMGLGRLVGPSPDDVGSPRAGSGSEGCLSDGPTTRPTSLPQLCGTDSLCRQLHGAPASDRLTQIPLYVQIVIYVSETLPQESSTAKLYGLSGATGTLLNTQRGYVCPLTV